MIEKSLADLQKIGQDLQGTEIPTLLDDYVIEIAFRIRAVETALLEEFQKGNISGTIHTCIGQELSPAIIGQYLIDEDFLTSNHRCHGHFIVKTNNWKGLVLEILGSREGVCRGVGSSQHLYAEGFISNGPQGNLLPVGTGVSNWLKSNNSNGIVISFMGEGTLGEGITYEALNLAAITNSPQLFVCENNFYSQSTAQSASVAGSILNKAESYGMRVFSCNIWEPDRMNSIVEDSIKFVRETQSPAFLLIQCYRLMAHSKGDDNRDPFEIDLFANLDPISKLIQASSMHKSRFEQIKREVNEFIDAHGLATNLELTEYAKNQLPIEKSGLMPVLNNPKMRTVDAIRTSIETVIESGGFLIGEDICDPYGGAFKATRGISTKFPESVLNSPICEAGLVGFAIGRAVKGQPVIAEIMFGDFITYAFDQIVNNASKFFHVYGISSGLPVVIRVPSGGHRGYGPTHSQSLEKHLLGIDNVLVIAISSLLDPIEQFSSALRLRIPTLAIENKIGYARLLFQNQNSLILSREENGLGIAVVSTKGVHPDVTVITYGELARDMADNLSLLEEELGLKIEVICLLQLHPVPIESILERDLGKLIIVAEEGSKSFGLGAEIGALLLESPVSPRRFSRVSAEPYPIASNRILEEDLLANISKIKEAIRKGIDDAE